MRQVRHRESDAILGAMRRVVLAAGALEASASLFLRA
jgi:hypothetical protein